MDFFKLIAKRRSIRKYQEKKVEPEKVALIVEAALRSPSAKDLQPWEFIVVSDRKIIDELAKAKQAGSSFLAGAPLAIVVCGESERSDVWLEDVSIASIFISLAAEAAGLGNCWIQIRERKHDATQMAEEFVREVLKIPQNLRVESIIAIGYSDEQKPGHSKEELQFGKIFSNAHGCKFEI